MVKQSQRCEVKHQLLVSNRTIVHVKVIVLLCNIQDRLLHGFGWILVLIRLWIIMEYICSLILFNILLYIQIVVHHKDWLLLAIIWSKRIYIAVRRVRRAWSKIRDTYSRGGVPQAYLTLKKEGCNGCARSPWNSKGRLYQQGRRPWSRYVGLSKLFRHQLEEEETRYDR